MTLIRHLKNSAFLQFVLKASLETVIAALVYGGVYVWVVRFLDPGAVVIRSPAASVGQFFFLMSAHTISGYWIFLAVLATTIKFLLPQRVPILTILLTLGGVLYIGCTIAFGEVNNTTLSVAISTLVGSSVVLVIFAFISYRRMFS